MNFSIGCDHAGTEYKDIIINHLKERGFSVTNCGTDGLESVDYPDYAHEVAKKVSNKSSDLGILICGSANGVAMTANKHSDIRAGVAWTPEVAELARTHNDSNVLCIPARFVTENEAINIVDSFINATFEGGRHARRVGKIACGILAFFFGISTSFGQAKPPISSINFANEIHADQLKGHLGIIASDGFQGRETGEAGQKLCAAYLESYYRSLGFKPYDGQSFFQMVPMTHSQIFDGSVILEEDTLKIVDDFLLYPGINKESMDSVAMVFAGFGINNGVWNDYSDIDIPGKMVVMLSGEPENSKGISLITGTKETSDWGVNIRKKRELVDSLGAAGLLVLMPEKKLSKFRGRMKYYMMRKSTVINREKEGEGSELPTFFVSDDDASIWLTSGVGVKSAEKVRKKTGKKGSSITSDLSSLWSHKIDRFKRDFFAENVLAYLPGSDSLLSKELLIITSHYDHIGIIDDEINNGADDDGSGTVTVMELAESFMIAKNKGFGPKRSVLFMNVVGEEKGLLGSEWYADHPVWPLENTVANLNIDMIGRVDPAHEGDENYVYLIGADKLSSELHEISEEANREYTNLTLDYTFNEPDDPNRFYYRSDHYNFAKNNIPVIFYFCGVHEDYHAPGDDPEKIMYDKLEKIGKLVFHTAWKLLNRDEKIIVDKVNDFPEDR